MFTVRRCVVLLVVVLSVESAQANLTLSFDPSAQTVGLGDSAGVAINISGLGDFAPDSLSAFDFDVSFDNSIVSFNSVVFGDPILGDQLDLFALGSLTSFDDSVPGSVNLVELSFDLPNDLDTLQAGSFTLATMTFDAIGFGTTDLLFDLSLPNALGDSLGAPLTATAAVGQISVVPVPSAVLLGALGLGMAGCIKRRVKEGQSAFSDQ